MCSNQFTCDRLDWIIHTHTLTMVWHKCSNNVIVRIVKLTNECCDACFDFEASRTRALDQEIIHAFDGCAAASVRHTHKQQYVNPNSNLPVFIFFFYFLAQTLLSANLMAIRNNSRRDTSNDIFCRSVAQRVYILRSATSRQRSA